MDIRHIFKCIVVKFMCLNQHIGFMPELWKDFTVILKSRCLILGLANENIDIKMALSNDASSIYKNVDDGMYDLVKLVNATEFFKEKNIKHIDLMKINIEGGEYDLLEHLLDSGFVKNIENIQVQFHAFVPNAEERLHKIE